jgi:transposase
MMPGTGCSANTTRCWDADMPETTRLAETSTWWPAVEAFLKLRVTNARTEGSNRVVKQLKRVGCGYRNQANYERRIVLHVAAKSAA